MQSIMEMYRDDILGLRGALNNTSNALDDRTRRKIWAAIGAEIQLSAVYDPDITDEEMEAINNVLDQPIL